MSYICTLIYLFMLHVAISLTWDHKKPMEFQNFGVSNSAAI